MRALKQRSEIRDNPANPVSETLQRVDNQFALNNPRFVERYAKGELKVVLHVRVRNGKEYFAYFQGKTGVSGVSRLNNHSRQIGGGEGVRVAREENSCDLLPLTRQHVVMRDRACSRKQKAMLVDVVKVMETPEINIPSIVWFEPVDDGLCSCMDSLYYSSSLGRSIFLRTIANGKSGDTINRGTTVSQDKLSNQMVEGTSKVLNGVSGKSRNGQRNVSSAVKCPFDPIRITIVMDRNLVGVAIEKSVDSRVEVLDVLLGPIGLDGQHI